LLLTVKSRVTRKGSSLVFFAVIYAGAL